MTITEPTFFSKEREQKEKEAQLMEKIKEREKRMLESGYYAWSKIDNKTVKLQLTDLGRSVGSIILAEVCSL